MNGQTWLPTLRVECDGSVAAEALTSVDRSRLASTATAATAAAAVSVTGGLNQHLQSLIAVYTGSCKLFFDRLSQRIQQLIANRAELLRYDSATGESVPISAPKSFYCSS